MAQPNPDSASPDISIFEDSNNIDESHDIFDELQAGPQYNLHDHSTIGPTNKYGFSHVNAIADESSTYQEASSFLEWQLAMSEKLAALDRIGTWILFCYRHMQFLLHASGYSKLRPSQMLLLSDIKLVLLLEVYNTLREKTMMKLLLLLLT